MPVSDNEHQISEITESQVFLDWLNTTNDDIISKLNLSKVFDGASGDGISVLVGTTSGTGTSGIMLVEMSGNVTKGITFSDVTINGSLNYDFSSSTVSVALDFVGSEGATQGFTFGNIVRLSNTGGGATGWAAGGITLGRGINSTEAEIVGIVSSISGTDENTVHVITHGIIQGSYWGSVLTSGGTTLQNGCVYFADPSAYGKITKTEPNSVGLVSKPVLIGITGDTGLVLHYRGQEIGASGASGAAVASLVSIIDLGVPPGCNLRNRKNG